MIYVLGFAFVGLLSLYLYGLYRAGRVSALLKALRVVVGGGALAVAGLMALGGRIGPAGILAAVGASILLRGQLGPIDFRATQPDRGATSSVRSRYIHMELDHESGDMWGKIVAGDQRGADLIDLGEDESRRLYAEIGSDPDSIALFETWLDKYRDGWRDYFGGPAGSGGEARSSGLGGLDEAYAVLGLSPGASEADINTAHRRMMKNVHPDHGGSSYLASKVNEARDMLLKHIGKR